MDLSEEELNEIRRKGKQRCHLSYTLFTAYVVFIFFGIYVYSQFNPLLRPDLSLVVYWVSYQYFRLEPQLWTLHLFFGLICMAVSWALINLIKAQRRRVIGSLLIAVSVPSVILLIWLNSFQTQPLSSWFLVFSVVVAIPMIIYAAMVRITHVNFRQNEGSTFSSSIIALRAVFPTDRNTKCKGNAMSTKIGWKHGEISAKRRLVVY